MPWKRFAKSMGASSRRKESNYKVRESTRPGRDLHSEWRATSPPAAAAPATCSLYVSVGLNTAYSTGPMNNSVLSQPSGFLNVDRWIDYLIPVEASGFRPHRTTEPLPLCWAHSSGRRLTDRLSFLFSVGVSYRA